jgi:putative membrane protein
MMGYGCENGWIIMLIGGLIVVGVIALIVYALLRVSKASGNPRTSAPHEMQDSNSRALAILSERYARGEISDDEYKQKKNEITKL